MLKLTFHSGLFSSRCEANQLGTLDVAYQKKSALANYVVMLSLRGSSEDSLASVRNYPHWSASVSDVVARALAQTLCRAAQIPSSTKPNRRCAHATRICTSVERMTAACRGHEVGTVEILQEGDRRGPYTAVFDEEVLGQRRAQFEYGCKALNPAELLMRAICWASFDTDIIGSIPKLLLPTSLKWMVSITSTWLPSTNQDVLVESSLFDEFTRHLSGSGSCPQSARLRVFKRIQTVTIGASFCWGKLLSCAFAPISALFAKLHINFPITTNWTSTV